MGAGESTLIEPMLSYCSKEALNSKKCMYRHNYDRNEFAIPCKESFKEYKECKERWMVVRKMVMSGKLTETPPNEMK